MNKDDCPIIDLGEHGHLKMKHFFATLQGYCEWTPAPPYWFGWGGDLASFAGDVEQINVENKKLAAVKLLCQSKKVRGGEAVYANCPNHFFYEDFIADVDAIGISKLILNRTMSDESHVFSDIIDDYYRNHIHERRQNLIDNIIGQNAGVPSFEYLFNAIKIMEETGLDSSIWSEYPSYPELVAPGYTGVLSVLRILSNGAGTEAAEAAYFAFARYIVSAK